MDSTLFTAAILGNVNAVADQLRAGGAELLLKGNAKGETVMHVAAKLGHTQLVKYLACEHQMAADITGPHGQTPLHLAALNGKVDAVVELLKLPLMQQQQLIAAVDRHGYTALHLAVRHAHVDIVRFLLTNLEGKQVMDQLTCRDHLGWTVVHSAAAMGRGDIIEEIFKNCPDIALLKQAITAQWSPLHVASWLGHVDMAKFMCEKLGFCVNTTGNSLEGLTPLHMAAHNGQDAVVDYLLSHKDLQLDYCDALQRTALHYAARQGHISVVCKFLSSLKLKALDSCSLIEATDVSGFTALHLAAKEGHEQVVRVLLEGRANVNAKTKSSAILESLLASASSSNSTYGTVQVDPMILEADCRCINQMTALHLAARNGHMAVVRQLLRRSDVDIRALDGHGLMAQDWAKVGKVQKEFLVCLEQVSQSAGQLSTRASNKKLQILRESVMKWKKMVVGMPPSTFCSFQSMQYMTEVCDDLDEVCNSCEQDAKASDWNASSSFEKEKTRGRNRHGISDDEDMDTTVRLLQEIHEITAQDEFSGNTPLHVAVRRGQKKAVEVLVKCGPIDEVNARNSEGSTPLAIAFENNDVEICKLILHNTEKVEDDLHEMLIYAMDKNWFEMGALLLGDARMHTGGGIGVELLEGATNSVEKRFLELLVRRSTIKERLLQERKEHLDAAGAMLVIAAFIASVTYQGDLQPPEAQHHRACSLFNWLNAMAFYTAVAATISLASGSLPIRHIFELVDAREPMQISRGISCVLLIMSSACVVWAYAAAGFCKASGSKAFLCGNGAGAIATSLFLFWFLKHYIQLYKPFYRRLDPDNEGYMCTLCKRIAQAVRKLPRMFFRQENDSLHDDLLQGSHGRSTVAV